MLELDLPIPFPDNVSLGKLFNSSESQLFNLWNSMKKKINIYQSRASF